MTKGSRKFHIPFLIQQKASTVDRFAYIKYSDVAAEVEYIFTKQIPIVNNGPLNYIFNFLKWANNKDTLLVSFDSSDNMNRTFKYRNVTARTYVDLSKKKYLHYKFGPLIQTIFEIVCVFKQLRLFKPTWILCSRAKGALIGCYLYAKIHKVPLVISRHGSMEIERKKILARLISKFSFYVIRNAAAVLCHGPYLRDQLLKQNINPNKIFEFNLSYQNLILQKGLREPESDKTILYLGRLKESKGATDLFNACADLLHEYADLKLAYVGDGECLNKLKELAKIHNIEEKVVFYGQIEHTNIREIIEKSRFLVMPTRAVSDEGRPKAAIEALVFGRPVIAPDFGSFKYLIEDGYNGLFYEPDNLRDLTAKIKTLIDSNELYESLKNGAKQYSKRFMSPDLSFTDALRYSYALNN